MTIINGIDVDNIEPSSANAFPAVVAGRVLHLDGDPLIYQYSYDDDKTLPQCVENFWSMVEYRRRMTGSAFVAVHFTAGNKGGRFDIAQVKEYQVMRRKTKEKTTPPKNFLPLKDHLFNHISAAQCGTDCKVRTYIHEDQEADDGMAQGNYDAIIKGERNLSVIQSIDKDLRMCSGLHADWDTMEIRDVDGFGFIELVTKVSKTTGAKDNQIKGFGTAFFWAQLLMGDYVDSIPGLPKLGVPMLNRIDPTKKTTEDLYILESHTEESTKYKAALKRLMNRKPKACGTMMAWNILKDCKSDLDAMKIVIEAYQSFYGTENFEFEAWRGDRITVNSGKMLLEQAKLLWMRRVLGECPSAFFRNVIEGKKWDGKTNAQ